MLESRTLATYFGADYLNTYAACKTAEYDKFERHISAREFAWYLQPE
jgi:glutamine synthetase